MKDAEYIKVHSVEEAVSVEPADVAIAGIDLKVYRLESVIVNDLKRGMLNTRLELKHNNRHLQVDYPAEKAVVLALRAGAPILMEECLRLDTTVYKYR